MKCIFSALVPFFVTLASAGQESQDLNFYVPNYNEIDTEELLAWDPPAELKHEYPYYLSGFDYENSPIWVAPLGKWDTRKSVDNGPGRERDFRMYVLQFLKRCELSVELRSTSEEFVEDFAIIVDMDGYSMYQTTSTNAMKMSIWMARQFEQAFSNRMKVAYIVNANFVFTTVWNMMKPILGQNVYKVDIFGSNKDTWVPILLKHFPRDQLSKRYGGTRNFKPIQVYG